MEQQTAEYSSWVEVDLAAIRHNYLGFKSLVGPDINVFGVVKANAYGHGVIPVSKTLIDAGADTLAVNRVLEAEEIRAAGIGTNILILGFSPVATAKRIVDLDLTPSVMHLELAQAINKFAIEAGKIIKIHIKVDTGLNRFGLFPDEVLPFLKNIRDLPGIKVEGIFTHLATADWQDQKYSVQQVDRFNRLLEEIKAAGIDIPVVHAGGSSGASYIPYGWYNAVRPGISMYGLESSDVLPPKFVLRPALTIKTRIARIRWISAGEGVSYGRLFVAEKGTRVALLPIGYGDGFHRSQSCRAQVLVRGHKVPVIGRVCMDQCVADVTSVPEVLEGDEVVVVGKQLGAEITATEAGITGDTNNYEIVTGLLPRLPRIYLNA